MENKLYVGNLSYSMNNTDIESLFSQFGEVSDVNLITDRETGRSKGFAFVEMSNKESADKAIEELDGTEQQGRSIRVNVARPKN